MTANFDDLQLEPELTAEEFAFELEPIEEQPAAAATPAATVAAAPEPSPVALMQVLPADFPLPTLIRFVPDPALRTAAEQAAKYALSLEIVGDEGVTRGDAACTALRASLKGIEAHFEQPAEIANRLHKQITGTRAEWCAAGKAALDTVGRRVATEQRRLQAEEAERRRKAQEEEDRKARERAREEAKAAEQAQAPAPVVQELKRQAETATAPPVPVSAPAPKLSGSSVTGTWKARFKGTSGDPEPNPTTEQMTPVQKKAFMDLLRAIVDGEHQLVGVQPDWKYWGARAKSDKSTLDAPGIEAFEDLGLRGKASRSR